jgi:release factor glutamine methyltransferase
MTGRTEDMSQSEPWTIRRLLEWTTGYLREKGFPTPRLDAEVLLAEALGRKRIELYTAYDQVASEGARQHFRDLVRRRAEGAPVAYLVGHREFYSHRFRVTPDVLIPRPETEFLIVTLLDLVSDPNWASHPVEIVDVGTGSGILAVCAALHVPHAQVTAIDVSSAALDVARANAEDHGVADRIQFVEANLLDSMPDRPCFHFVLSNPPYVSRSEWDQLAVDVKDYEPQVALLAGETGMAVISQLVPLAATRLHPRGWLILEISPMIESEVHQQIARDGRFDEAATIKDLSRSPRVVRARRRADV